MTIRLQRAVCRRGAASWDTIATEGGPAAAAAPVPESNLRLLAIELKLVKFEYNLHPNYISIIFSSYRSLRACMHICKFAGACTLDLDPRPLQLRSRDRPRHAYAYVSARASLPLC